MKQMTAYEFTMMQNDFTNKVAPCAYDEGILARTILARAPRIRTTAHYDECYDMYIELTMSCTPDEAMNWCKYWMANAVAYGKMTRNLDWREKFLAACDLEYNLAFGD